MHLNCFEDTNNVKAKMAPNDIEACLNNKYYDLGMIWRFQAYNLQI